MRFLKKNNKVKKTILVISDLHLGAGSTVNGRRNHLEDFHSDKELCDFFEYYSSKEYQNMPVELIINGDFLDLLAVPFVRYFDDEFWSEKASLEKLEMIINAHKEVFESLKKFVETKNKSLVYIIGNHDGELVFKSLKDRFFSIFAQECHEKIILTNSISTYCPAKGIYLEHGHEYEAAHAFDLEDTTIEAINGDKYFRPAWGAYYVTHVINKYKQERSHANAIRPIQSFLIHGLIFDTFFTIRFIIANIYYFVMVRFMYYYRLKNGWKKVIADSLDELHLFQDFEELTREFFKKKRDARVLIVGHTHEASYREFSDGTKFINTGTWTKMIRLDFQQSSNQTQLTYAKIELEKEDYSIYEFHKFVDVNLYCWEPKTTQPFEEYR